MVGYSAGCIPAFAPPRGRADPRSQRPAMVLIHGGAFVSGDKTGDHMPELATALAQRGYVVASINYRLTGEYWGVVTCAEWDPKPSEDPNPSGIRSRVGSEAR